MIKLYNITYFSERKIFPAFTRGCHSRPSIPHPFGQPVKYRLEPRTSIAYPLDIPFRYVCSKEWFYYGLNKFSEKLDFTQFNVLMKVRYESNNLVPLGPRSRQSVASFNYCEQFRSTLCLKLRKDLDRTGNTLGKVLYIRLYITPLNKILENKYRYYKGKRFGISIPKYVDTKAVVPISMHESAFERELFPDFDEKSKSPSFKYKMFGLNTN